MKRYWMKHILQTLLVLVGITFLSFLILYMAPGDPAQMRLSAQGTAISEEVLEEMREEMGLNDSFFEQYKRWLLDILHGDLGVSYKDGLPVAGKLFGAFYNTLKLAGMTILISLVVSIPLGIWTAVRKGKIEDILIRLIAFFGNSVPNFIIAVLLMYVFCIQLKWFPVLSNQSARGIILPSVALAIPITSRFIRQFRAAIIEEIGKEYVLGARARGVRWNIILIRNVFRNALITILTVIGMSIGTLLGGSVVIEKIFTWPGVGKLVMDSISARDYPMIQAFVMIMSIVYVAINMLTDLSYKKLDPRVRKI